MSSQWVLLCCNVQLIGAACNLWASRILRQMQQSSEMVGPHTQQHEKNKGTKNHHCAAKSACTHALPIIKALTAQKQGSHSLHDIWVTPRHTNVVCACVAVCVYVRPDLLSIFRSIQLNPMIFQIAFPTLCRQWSHCSSHSTLIAPGACAISHGCDDFHLCGPTQSVTRAQQCHALLGSLWSQVRRRTQSPTRFGLELDTANTTCHVHWTTSHEDAQVSDLCEHQSPKCCHMLSLFFPFHRWFFCLDLDC